MENIWSSPAHIILPYYKFLDNNRLYLQSVLEDMAADPVYREFIYLSYQAEKQRAEQAKAQLILERQRAKRLAEQLRSLGIFT